MRKRVSKRENLRLRYTKLKNQYRTMERFSRTSEGLVARLYGEHDNTIEYSDVGGHCSLWPIDRMGREWLPTEIAARTELVLADRFARIVDLPTALA